MKHMPLTTHPEFGRIICSEEDERPPCLKTVARRIHAGNHASPKSRGLIPHGVIRPREERRLNAVMEPAQ